MNERARATFTDAAGDSWRVIVTIGKIKAVRQLVNDDTGKSVDLFEYVNDNLAYRLYIDPVLLADVLWVLCKDEAEGRKIDKSAFLDRLNGETLEVAELAFEEAFIDFFPKSQRGQAELIAQTAREFRTTLRKTQQEAVLNEIRKQTPASSGT